MLNSPLETRPPTNLDKRQASASNAQDSANGRAAKPASRNAAFAWLDQEAAFGLAAALAILVFYTILVWANGPPASIEAGAQRATAGASARR